ncbi:hypothetical protein ACLMAL_06520 [Nocardia sp. CWNU-33]|uniref:hypothetical protein n=1 Tax=Nocardia sp. CWNU-33 TaxID=3392117 RepID=UPI00398F32A5
MTTPQHPDNNDKPAAPTGSAPRPPEDEAPPAQPGSAPQPTGSAPQPTGDAPQPTGDAPQPPDAGSPSLAKEPEPLQPSGTEWATPAAGGPDNYPQTGAPQESRYGGFPAYTQQPYQEYGAAPQRSGAQIYSIIAFVCAALSLLFCPILFGPAGIILGVIGRNKGESLGKVAVIVAAVAMVIGIVVSYIVLAGDALPDQS